MLPHQNYNTEEIILEKKGKIKIAVAAYFQ
jgi:hypothetical protein